MPTAKVSLLLAFIIILLDITIFEPSMTARVFVGILLIIAWTGRDDDKLQ